VNATSCMNTEEKEKSCVILVNCNGMEDSSGGWRILEVSKKVNWGRRGFLFLLLKEIYVIGG
jgi:hypothetical protein